MEKKVYLFLADGFEDIEALTVVDMLRRAGVQIVTVSIMGRREVTTSHRVTVLADALFEEVEGALGEAAVLVLPGGQPGTTNLGNHQGLCEALLAYAAAGGHVAAICAAPTVLNRLGLLEGKKATSYPSCEPQMDRVGQYLQDRVVVDGNITTSRGMGTAIDFSLSLIQDLCGEKKAEELAAAIVYTKG